MTPRSPYHLRTADVVDINVPGAFADSPINGSFSIQAGGIVDLGPPYGTVNIGGKTIDEAKAEITAQLSKNSANPKSTSLWVKLLLSSKFKANTSRNPMARSDWELTEACLW